MNKLLRFQDIVIMDVPCTLPSQLSVLFQAHSSKMQEIVQGKGSVFATHVDSLLLSSYLQNVTCPLNLLDASVREFHHIPTRRYEKVFTSEEVTYLTEVYQTIYTNERVLNVPLVYEYFHEIEVLGEQFNF